MAWAAIAGFGEVRRRLGGEDGKTLRQIEPQRPAKERPGADAGAIRPVVASIQQFPQEVEVLLFRVVHVQHS